ncbi:hypothetical protein [Paenibacillus senegalensis]|uniref:hypothetical protein n=1 Tax=Paenibacillus senegalensis TaxID=1465766 RepID=UPI0002FE3062|nr:hypothetical protein [Paenibacillus senegalensis]
MRRKITWLFTLIAVAICFIHFFGYDPKNMILLSLSVPLWFLTMATDLENISLFIAYGLTIASWALMGYFVDRWITSDNRNQAS